MAGDSATERLTALRRMLALFLAETGRHQLQEAKSNQKIRVSLAKVAERALENSRRKLAKRHLYRLRPTL